MRINYSVSTLGYSFTDAACPIKRNLIFTDIYIYIPSVFTFSNRLFILSEQGVGTNAR